MSRKDTVPQPVVKHSVHYVSCIHELRGWYQSGQGKNVAAGVQTVVEKMSRDVFGYYALQLGDLAGRYTLLQDSRISNCFSVASLVDAEITADLVADAAALPCEFDNIDLVVASHVLDYAHSPHQVLREIERVLLPEGHCILIAYNPFSLRGINLAWRRLRKQEKTPVMFTSFRLHDWFTVLGFEVLETHTTGFSSRISDSVIFRQMSWLRRPWQKCCQLFGSVQIIHVRKKVSKQIPLKPKLRAKPILKPGIAVNGGRVGKSLNKSKHDQGSKG